MQNTAQHTVNTRDTQVRQDPRTEAFYVDGLTSLPVVTAGAALAALASALAHRATRAHKLNAHSSRSHCLLSFQIRSADRSADGVGGGGVRRGGKLVLVDLAGSERLKGSGSGAGGEREALRETGAINKSLFTLGQVCAVCDVCTVGVCEGRAVGGAEGDGRDQHCRCSRWARCASLQPVLLTRCTALQPLECMAVRCRACG